MYSRGLTAEFRGRIKTTSQATPSPDTSISENAKILRAIIGAQHEASVKTIKKNLLRGTIRLNKGTINLKKSPDGKFTIEKIQSRRTSRSPN